MEERLVGNGNSSYEEIEEEDDDVQVISMKRKRKSEGSRYGVNWTLISIHPGLFKDDTLSQGGKVKARGEVLRQQSMLCGRPPNMSCRIETFGRICQKFDETRTRWVTEMGFGGLLHFVSDMHLPRQLALDNDTN